MASNYSKKDNLPDEATQNFNDELKTVKCFAYYLWLGPNRKCFGNCSTGSTGQLVIRHCRRLRDGGKSMKKDKNHEETYDKEFQDGLISCVLTDDHSQMLKLLATQPTPNFEDVLTVLQDRNKTTSDDELRRFFFIVGCMLRNYRPLKKEYTEITLPDNITMIQYEAAARNVLQLYVHRRHIQTRLLLHRAYADYTDRNILGLYLLSELQFNNLLSTTSTVRYGHCITHPVRDDMTERLRDTADPDGQSTK